MAETTDPRWRIVADRDDQPWPCTIIDADGRSLLGTHNGTPVIRSRELAERIVNTLNADSVRDTEAVHWVGDEVTCRLCLSILELDPPATPARTTVPDRDIPVGTRVLAFPGSRDGRALMTRTRTPVWDVAGEPVVSVDGYAGGIALTHIEVLPEGGDADG